MNRSIAYFLIAVALALRCVVGAAANEPPSLDSLEQAAIRAAVEAVESAVVRIDFIGSATSDGQLQAAGSTTGLIVSADGLVVTSRFGLETPPASILATLHDGRQVPATLLATDNSRQLALLRLDVEGELKPAAIAPLLETIPGQYAIAVGRALAMERPSVSVGIVSALGRLQGRAVQTDASISPANYGGPLIDIQGRVIGVLTPLSADSSEGASGTDWYDSGIGFAVPLDGYESSLKRLQSGEELHRGRIGIAFTSGNPMETPPEIASVRARGPAALARLQAGDLIVAVDGAPTDLQATFRRQLGRYYAGDSIDLTVERDGAKFEASMTLVRELEPFRHVELGLRVVAKDEIDAGVVEVTQVLPGGPADIAGVEAGDIVTELDEQAIANRDELAVAIQRKAPGDAVQLQFVRGTEPMTATVTLGEQSVEPFPVKITADPVDDGAAPPGEIREFKLPEFATPCPLYVPADAPGAPQLGLLIVLQAGSEAPSADALRSWQHEAERNRLVLAMPGPQTNRGWAEGDLEYIQQLLRTLIERFDIDATRVALAGNGVENRVTLAIWLTNRERLRGVALDSAELPERFRPPENEADQPCRFILSTVESDRLTPKFLKTLRDLGYAVAAGSDNSPELVAAWTNSLDRL